MEIETKAIMSVTEANQNFSKAAKAAEQNGQIVIFKNNRPKYILVDLDTSEYVDIDRDSMAEAVKKTAAAGLEAANGEVPAALPRRKSAALRKVSADRKSTFTEKTKVDPADLLEWVKKYR